MTLPRHSASVLIPELLHEILSQLPLRDVAMAAITCQGWKESALDILWETVDLVDLLNVLAPTRKRAKELVSNRPRLSSCCPFLSSKIVSICYSISLERSHGTTGRDSITWLFGFEEESSARVCITR